MAPSVPRFRLPGGINAESLASFLTSVGSNCWKTGQTRALILADGDFRIGRAECQNAMAPLAGFPRGTRIAFVAASADTYEHLVTAENAGLRNGIMARVFFNEQNAFRWLCP